MASELLGGCHRQTAGLPLEPCTPAALLLLRPSFSAPTRPAPARPENSIVAWCAAHPRPFTLALGKARPMDPGQRYDEALWRRHMRTAARRVNAAAWVMG